MKGGKCPEFSGSEQTSNGHCLRESQHTVFWPTYSNTLNSRQITWSAQTRLKMSNRRVIVLNTGVATNLKKKNLKEQGGGGCIPAGGLTENWFLHNGQRHSTRGRELCLANIAVQVTYLGHTETQMVRTRCLKITST